MNDTYTKTFSKQEEAQQFADMIAKLYPEQSPKVWS
jgi:hypothetical protein